MSTPSVGLTQRNETEHRREIVTALNRGLQGYINSTGTFTIVSGTTTTVVTNVLAHENSIPLFTPLGTPVANLQVTARAKGSFTITHAAPGANTLYGYAILG